MNWAIGFKAVPLVHMVYINGTKKESFMDIYCIKYQHAIHEHNSMRKEISTTSYKINYTNNME